MKSCIEGIICWKPTNPIHQTTYFSKLNKTHNPRNQGLEIWNTSRKIENPYLFLKIGEEMMKKNGVFESEHGEFGRGRQWIVTICEGKLKSFWKLSWKRPIMRKTRVFLIGVSREQVPSASRQKLVWQNFKNLSKFFSRLEVPLARRESPNILSKPCD